MATNHDASTPAPHGASDKPLSTAVEQPIPPQEAHLDVPLDITPATARRLALVAAVDANMTIGLEGHMPWHFPEDLRYFKQLTLGHDVIMGRVTFEAIGRPLPGRRNMVVSRNAAWQHAGCEVFSSLKAAIAASEDALPFIIGGATLYAESMPLATDLYLTHIDQAFDGDRFFPDLDASWHCVSERPSDSAPLRFCHYQRHPSAA